MTTRRLLAAAAAAALLACGAGRPGGRTPRDDLLKRLAGRPEPDYLARVRAYADHMIEFGRDRYGKEHSPLFASTLTRTRPPALLPPPEFAPVAKPPAMPADLARWPGHPSPWAFQKFANLPTLHALGSEDAHKETVVGEDVLEHMHLYRTLWKLADLTGDARYRREADDALRWWFTRTQSPATGLYPWGEHLGWDFREDDASYTTPPYHTLYSRIHHEPRAVRFDDFLDLLATIPAQAGQRRTPLERFAEGLRRWHVWDLERGYFTRHGDYFGNVEPAEHAEYPRIAGWFFDVWSKAFAASADAAFKADAAAWTEALADATIARAKAVGFVPFTARHETQGGKPEAYSPRQVLNMAAKVAAAAERFRPARPDLAAKLAAFADRECRYYADHGKGKPVPAGEWLTLLAAFEMTGRPDLKDLLRQAADAAAAYDPTTDPAWVGARPWAEHIAFLARAHVLLGDARYLQAARASGRMAVDLLLDDASPLPKVSSRPIYLPSGEEFPVFYHGALYCDDLMYALAELAAAMRPAAPAAGAP